MHPSSCRTAHYILVLVFFQLCCSLRWKHLFQIVLIIGRSQSFLRSAKTANFELRTIQSLFRTSSKRTQSHANLLMHL